MELINIQNELSSYNKYQEFSFKHLSSFLVNLKRSNILLVSLFLRYNIYTRFRLHLQIFTAPAIDSLKPGQSACGPYQLEQKIREENV